MPRRAAGFWRATLGAPPPRRGCAGCLGGGHRMVRLDRACGARRVAATPSLLGAIARPPIFGARRAVVQHWFVVRWGRSVARARPFVLHLQVLSSSASTAAAPGSLPLLPDSPQPSRRIWAGSVWMSASSVSCGARCRHVFCSSASGPLAAGTRGPFDWGARTYHSLCFPSH